MYMYPEKLTVGELHSSAADHTYISTAEHAAEHRTLPYLLYIHAIVELAHHVAKFQRPWQVVDHILRGKVAVVLVVQRFRDEVSCKQAALLGRR